jgi:hypothetical protein
MNHVLISISKVKIEHIIGNLPKMISSHFRAGQDNLALPAHVHHIPETKQSSGDTTERRAQP